MLAAPFSTGVGIYVFYALQPYLLELYGDEDAYSIAGLAAAAVAGAQIAGGWAAPRIRRLFGKRTTALILAGIADGLVLAVLGVAQAFWLGVALVVLWGCLGGRAADPAGLSERDDSVAATRDGALVRLADGVERRCGDPTGSRADRGRVRLRHLARRRCGPAAPQRPVPGREPPRTLAGRHGNRVDCPRPPSRPPLEPSGWRRCSGGDTVERTAPCVPTSSQPPSSPCCSRWWPPPGTCERPDHGARARTRSAVQGDGELPGTALGTLTTASGFFPQVFGQTPDPTQRQRPAGTLGPRYVATYLVPGPNGSSSRLVQHLYPYAKPVALRTRSQAHGRASGRTAAGSAPRPRSSGC